MPRRRDQPGRLTDAPGPARRGSRRRDVTADAREAGRQPRAERRKNGAGGAAPARAGIVLATLILVATVANLNLSVANVALPSIAKAFDSSQTSSTSSPSATRWASPPRCCTWARSATATAASSCWCSAPRSPSPPRCWPRSRRRTRCSSPPASFGGLAAGMAYPTTLALITALWSGPPRTRAIALWSAVGGAMAAVGPLCAGLLLSQFWWGSVFLSRCRWPSSPGARRSARAGPRQRDHRARGPPRRHALHLFVGALVLGINFDHGADTTVARARAAGAWPWSARSPSWSGSGARPTRCSTCTSPPGGSSGWRPAPASSSSAR